MKRFILAATLAITATGAAAQGFTGASVGFGYEDFF